MSTTSDAVDGRRLFGRERGDRERHRHPMIAARVGDAARRPLAPVRAGDHESVRTLVGVDAERAEAGDERGDAIAFLDAQLARAANADLAAVRGKRGDGRQLVDQARDFVGRDVERPGRDRLRPTTLPRGSPAALAVTSTWTRAPKRRRTPSRAVRVGLRPTSSISTARSGQRRRGDQPEGGGREVARHRQRLPVQPLAAVDRDASGLPTSTAAAESGQRPLGVVARRGRFEDAWSCRRRAGRRAARRSSPARSASAAREQSRATARREWSAADGRRSRRCGRPFARAAR